MPTDAGDGLGGGAAVAGQHHDPQTLVVQRLDGFGGRGLDAVRDADQAGEAPSTATNITVSPLRRSASARAVDVTVAPISDSIAVLPIATVRPSTVPTTPLPVTDRKSVTGAELHAALLGAAHDGRRQRMLAHLLEARGQAQQRGLVDRRRGDDGRERGLAFGQRPGLVDDQRVDLLHHLQRLGVPEQHAELGAAAGADHDRHRRGQAERARARDDQHGDGVDEGVGQARLGPPDGPDGERHDGDAESRPARTSRTRCRPAAGSARASAAPRRPAGRSARAACRCRRAAPPSRRCRCR